MIEETGLRISVRERIATSDELCLVRGKYVRKRCTFFGAAKLEANTVPPVELDHELLWIAFDEAATALTHGSQKWALRLARFGVAQEGLITHRRRLILIACMNHFCLLLSFLALSAQPEIGWQSSTPFAQFVPDVPSSAFSKVELIESSAGRKTLRSQFPTRPGVAYQLEACAAIEAPTWHPVSYTFLAKSHMTSAELPVLADRSFYRLVEAPFYEEGPSEWVRRAGFFIGHGTIAD